MARYVDLIQEGSAPPAGPAEAFLDATTSTTRTGLPAPIQAGQVAMWLARPTDMAYARQTGDSLEYTYAVAPPPAGGYPPARQEAQCLAISAQAADLTPAGHGSPTAAPIPKRCLG